MKTRTLLTVLALAILAACGGNTPTGARAPEQVALDDAPAPADTSSTGRGGSYGSGH